MIRVCCGPMVALSPSTSGQSVCRASRLPCRSSSCAAPAMIAAWTVLAGTDASCGDVVCCGGLAWAVLLRLRAPDAYGACLAAAPIVVDASMLNGGASGLLNLVAIAGPNGQILLQQLPAVRLCKGLSVPAAVSVVPAPPIAINL